jgi:hypothetical protein
VQKELEVTATMAHALPPSEVERRPPLQRDLVEAARPSRASAKFPAEFTIRAEDFGPAAPPP